jgi:hypothetical protein
MPRRPARVALVDPFDELLTRRALPAEPDLRLATLATAPMRLLLQEPERWRRLWGSNLAAARAGARLP